MIINQENYFDYAEALHCYLTLNHEGLWSTEYELLCKSKFRPSPLWSESKVELENEVYSLINKDNFESLFSELNDFMLNKVN